MTAFYNRSFLRLIIISIIFTFITGISAAESTEEKSDLVKELHERYYNRGNYRASIPDKYFLGFGFSTFSGSGLTFLYRLSEENRIKSHLFYIMHSSDRNKNLNCSTGLEWQRNLHVGRSMRSYYLIGASIYAGVSGEHGNLEWDSLDGIFFLGPGIGFEFYITEKTVLSFTFGLQYSKQIKTSGYGITPGGGIDIAYGFY
jgi:hypothetical protein